MLQCTILIYAAIKLREDEMTMTIEPLLASANAQVKAIESLTSFGYAGTDRFALFNFYAGLAALDNASCFFTSLIQSKDIEELVELQMRAMLPTAESAKGYARQTLALAAATSLEFDHFIENQIYGFQEKVCEALNKELSHAEENGLLAAGMFKDALKVVKESAMSARATIKRAMYESLNLRPNQSNDDVTDVVAKPPKSERSIRSSVKTG
jgi:hypothetical protein